MDFSDFTNDELFEFQKQCRITIDQSVVDDNIYKTAKKGFKEIGLEISRRLNICNN